MFSRLPVSRLSRQMTRQSRSSRYSHRCEPRNPAPPVTTAVLIGGKRTLVTDRPGTVPAHACPPWACGDCPQHCSISSESRAGITRLLPCRAAAPRSLRSLPTGLWDAGDDVIRGKEVWAHAAHARTEEGADRQVRGKRRRHRL